MTLVYSAFSPSFSKTIPKSFNLETFGEIGKKLPFSQGVVTWVSP